MPFSSELQAIVAHSQLLQLQDSELQSLETFKRCVALRVKADRDYAQALTVVANTAKKMDGNGVSHESPLAQAFDSIVSGTEKIAQVLNEYSNKLNELIIEKLVQLISEKKQARKTFAEERTKLETQLNKNRTNVTRTLGEYERLLGKVSQERNKYTDNINKGKTRVRESEERYTQCTQKLHNVHNQYVCALIQNNMYCKSYSATLLPGLLTYQQDIQEGFVAQCRDLLTEYCSIIDCQKLQKIHEEMQKQVNSIIPSSEYDDFLNQNRTDPVKLDKTEFETRLIEDEKGLLAPNEVSVNDLTKAELDNSKSELEVKVNFTKQEIEKKEEAIKEAEKSSQEAGQDKDKLYESSRALSLLRKELKELQCQQESDQAQLTALDAAYSRLQGEEPPPGLVLADGQAAPPSQVTFGKDAGHLDSAKAKFTQMKRGFMSKLKRPAATTLRPAPPSKDFSPSGSNEGVNNVSDGEEEGDARGKEGYQKCDVPAEGSTVGKGKMTEHISRPLGEEDWFHGVLPRDEVVRLLQTDGDYLVRESRNKKTNEVQYVLSVMWSEPKHFIIQSDGTSWRFEGDSFPSIQELINNQALSGQPVTKKSQAFLRRAILREEWELNNDDIQLGLKLGHGNFGDVFKGLYKKRDVAVKTCKETLSEEQKKKFLQEGRILKQYDHPNIVKFIGIAAQRQPVMIVMEFISGGSLLSYLRKVQNNRMKQPKPGDLVEMCTDAASGMSYLEGKNCIHRDLAARNCLIVKETQTVKISDFGMSREEEEYTVSGGLKQIPIKWTAPEALNFGTYTSACDVWSFGVLMWEIFSLGATPYTGLSNNQAREKVDEGYRMEAPDDTPAPVYQLMLQCWKEEAKERPRFIDIFQSLKQIRTEL